MKPEDNTVTTYYILEVAGTYQRWADYPAKVLTKPRPFTGYVSGIDWGISISEDDGLMKPHRFDKMYEVTNYKHWGPWWFTPTSHKWIEVTVATQITRKEVSR